MSPIRADLLARAPAAPRVAWRRRLAILGLLGAACALYVAAGIALGLSPSVLFGGAWRLADMIGLMLPPDPGSLSRVQLYAEALLETLCIAFAGTLLAALIGCVFGFLAARNVVANAILHFLARRALDAVRSIDTLVWALIWVSVVGLGPFAGLLAIMCADMAAFGKLMSEAIETAQRGQIEGVASAGGGVWHRLRFGILPQVLPVMASQVLYFIESNTRSATILGVVGAGGIGLQLYEQIRVLEWQQVSFLILLILLVVSAIDWASARLRARLTGAA